MKTFKDIVFTARDPIIGGIRGVIEFENNYGISVIKGKHCYQDEGTYEVGILFEGSLTYDTDITSDVLSYQSIDDIDDIINKLQKL